MLESLGSTGDTLLEDTMLIVLNSVYEGLFHVL